MKFKNRLPAVIVIGFLIAGGAMLANRFFSSSTAASLVEVKVPALSEIAQRGETSFSKNCAACHGVNAAGSQKGPPLVHDIYNPGHHGDGAFSQAARRGVQRHHWPFGDMPPQPQVTNEEVAAITRYIRALQAANGILYKPHRM